ncbi:hypothetical protein LCGC14_0643020 [marine sediment metagenome]|uniref:Uncharacterized protein n=1 Tax=marine sediment metagenome TaxID=412755 RepID=A0A0F9RI46_9ZZZZ
MKETEEGVRSEDTRYEHKVYSTGSFFIKEGFYTEEEIRKLLECFQSRDKALRQSIKPIKEDKQWQNQDG